MLRSFRITAAGLVLACAFAGSAWASSSPSLSTGSATHIGQTSAVLNGHVNPNGAHTDYVFVWGTTTAYGYSSPAASAGSGTKSVAVSASIGGLLPGTLYHYRLQAINSHGAAIGVDHTFTTAGPAQPGVATGPASGVGTNSATLTGQIVTQGAATGYEFQYGTTTSYGSQTPSPPAAAAPANAPVTVTAPLSGLAAGTIFHFRLVAFHGNLPPTYGGDEIFMTLPSPRPAARIRVRTTPGHARRAPFVFTTSGRIIGPASIPAQFDCNGTVGVRFVLGHRQLRKVTVPVLPDCTFSATTRFSRLPGRGPRGRVVTLTVTVYFHGNGYLKGGFARAQRVTLR